MKETGNMSSVRSEFPRAARPDIFVCVNGLVPKSNPVRITRHSLSNWFAVKANLSFSDSLQNFVGNRVVLESIKYAVKIDGIGDDNVSPLIRWERWLHGLIDEVLVHCLPRSAGLVPGGEGLVDLEQDGVRIRDNRSLEPCSSSSSSSFKNSRALRYLQRLGALGTGCASGEVSLSGEDDRCPTVDAAGGSLAPPACSGPL